MDEFLSIHAASQACYRNLYGVHDSIKFNLLDQDIASAFFKKWMELTDQFVCPPQEVVSAAIDWRDDKAPLFNLQGSINVEFDENDIFTTVFEAEHLGKIMSPEDAITYQPLLTLLEDISDNEDPALFPGFESQILELTQELKPLSSLYRNYEITPPWNVKGPDEEAVVWMSNMRFSGIEEEYSPHNIDPNSPWTKHLPWYERANVARSYFGLQHLFDRTKCNSLMASLFIPVASLPPEQKLFRPNALDGSGDRFKAIYGNFEKQVAEKGDGRTLNLQKMGRERPHRGASEVVTRNFKPHGPISFAILGFLKSEDTPDNSNDNYYKSLKHTECENRDPENLARNLISLLR